MLITPAVSSSPPAPRPSVRAPDAVSDLGPLLESHRVVLCVGCGGVGKTTTCAALGLAAARRGKRVLCLTIDPAQRLAESLGLAPLRTEAQRVAPELLAAAGLEVPGSLTVMMLDPKSTFDGLIAALAPTAEKRDGILGNVIYQYVSTSLAGTQEYMAMEKLYAVKDDPSYDLVLLDTPPTSHALDFLDAPARLVDAIDSVAVRWLLRAFQASGGLSLNLLARTAATVLRGIGRIVGGELLGQIGRFAAELNDLFGGWRRRAHEVASALRGPDVAYVLVTTPERMCVREVLYFAERLHRLGMRPDAFVVNRVHQAVPVAPTAELAAQAVHQHGIAFDADGPERLAEAARQERRLAELDRLHLVAIDEVLSPADDASTEDRAEASPPVMRVPDFAQHVHDLRMLGWVADALAPSAAQPARAE
jgi:anion-transporting  ArsA/GET3 family ATPase